MILSMLSSQALRTTHEAPNYAACRLSRNAPQGPGHMYPALPIVFLCSIKVYLLGFAALTLWGVDSHRCLGFADPDHWVWPRSCVLHCIVKVSESSRPEFGLLTSSNHTTEVWCDSAIKNPPGACVVSVCDERPIRCSSKISTVGSGGAWFSV